MALNCFFCSECVVSGDNSKGRPLTVPPYGVAHTHCAEQDLMQKRLFRGLHIADLDEKCFAELKEMVLAEDNHRNGTSQEIDLF